MKKKIIDYTSDSSRKLETCFIPDCQSFNIISKSHGISDLGWCLSSLDQYHFSATPIFSRKTVYYHI